MARESTRRRLLQLTGAASLASLAGCASVANQFSGNGETTGTQQPSTTTSSGSTTSAASGGGESTPADDPASTGTADDEWSTESVTIDAPDRSLASVPVPETQNAYAVMGRAEATTTATLYGNWKCPYTQEFVRQHLPEVVDRFVTPGDLQLSFRSVAYIDGDPFLGPDAPRASRAGLAVWDVDPQSYWSYFAHVFANQPQERYAWAQPSLLVRFAKSSDVAGATQVRRSIQNGAYAGPVQTTAGTAAELGITSVPRLVVDGTITAPTVDFQATLRELSRAVDR